MKRIAYIRVSTQKQSYERQKHDFVEYFNRMGIDQSRIEYVTEKITSYSSFKQRAIYPILKKANNDTIIYACQLDRFGRSVQDVLDLVDFAMERGATLVTIDNGNTIENKSTTGKLLLTILAAVAEMERSLRAERCQAGLEAARAEIERNGFRIARLSGRKQTKWGNEKDTEQTKRIMATARESAAIVRADAAMEWKSQSVGYKWAMEKLTCGWTRSKVIEEFNKLHEFQPTVFCTREGKPLSRGVLSKWVSETNPLAI